MMIYVYKYNTPRDSTTVRYIVSQSVRSAIRGEGGGSSAVLESETERTKGRESYSGCKYIITIVIIIPSINIQSCCTYGDMILKTKYEIYFNLLTT